MRSVASLLLFIIPGVVGCAASASTLPMRQVEMIPEDRRPNLNGVIEVAPSYGHWGLEGWLLYLQPRAASTPGLCDLPTRYVVAPGTRTVQPNDPDAVKTGLRWAALDRPLSGAAQEQACRSLTKPSRNVAWLASDGESQVATGIAVLRDFMRSAARNDRAFRANLMCLPQSCARQRAQARKISTSMVIGMTRRPLSENIPYATWQFRLDDQAVAEAGIQLLDVPPSGAPYLVVPEAPGPGRRMTLSRYPSFD
jgi:hypothetical protein